MAAGTVAVSDVVVPRIFTPYTQKLTEAKSRIAQSGALVRSSLADGLLAGGGITFDLPAWNDLDNDADNVSTDAAGTASPNKIGSHQQVAVRLSRNQHWRAFDLADARLLLSHTKAGLETYGGAIDLVPEEHRASVLASPLSALKELDDAKVLRTKQAQGVSQAIRLLNNAIEGKPA